MGEKIKFNNGEIGNIVDYINKTNVTVKLLSSGRVLTHCNYSSIAKGYFPKN